MIETILLAMTLLQFEVEDTSFQIINETNCHTVEYKDNYALLCENLFCDRWYCEGNVYLRQANNIFEHKIGGEIDNK